MQQIVKLITTRIDDTQPIAGKMVGVEGADQYTKDDTQRHPYGCKTI
jgi:hypothetical protein